MYTDGKLPIIPPNGLSCLAVRCADWPDVNEESEDARTRFRARKVTWLDMSCQLDKGVQA